MTKLTIFKEQFKIDDTVALLIPKGAELLSCQLQNGQPCIWYLCDPTQPKEARVLRVIGTGHPIINQELKFIDTIQIWPLVFHVFELINVWD